MKIAFTHNCKRSFGEAEAEFDSVETVAAVERALRASGHHVVPIDVKRPLGDLVSKLEACAPDMILNTAEGVRGRARGAIYPALFDELDIPYTGSDSHVLTLTLDKHLTKLRAASAGVATPQSVFVHAADAALGQPFPFPCIIKPNFEGSSKGISDASIALDLAELLPKLRAALAAYPQGILVEEYIPGVDVAVPFFEELGDEVLSPCSYDIPSERQTRYRLYDYTLKNDAVTAEQVNVACPARVSGAAMLEVRAAAKRVVHALGIRNLGRVDFRVRDDGAVFFLEANATPSLEDGASLFVAASVLGLDYAATLHHVVEQAARRWRSERRARAPMSNHHNEARGASEGSPLPLP